MDVVEKAGTLVINYESLEIKIEQLKFHVDHINARAKFLKEKVTQVRPPYNQNADVEEWLKKQSQASLEFQHLNEDFQRHRWFNIPSYIRIQRKIKQLQTTFDQLSKSGSFQEVSSKMKYKSETQNLSANFVGDKFQTLKAEVNKWLESEIEVGGICGIGGIGKTALLEDVYFDLKNDIRYRICWVAMKKDSTVTELQDAIAMSLRVPHLNGNDLERRIDFLKTITLVDNLVIVLDNLCEWIPLHEVGIPIGKNGCKVIISTRSMTICRAMKCQRYIKMEYLEEEQSWELFIENHGKIEHEFEYYARSLVKKCEGLPLTILELARHMRDVDDVYEWKDMCNRIQSSAFDNCLFRKTFEVLECSYLGLESSQLKDYFLCCSLFPKDSVVERKMIIQVLIEGDLIESASDPSIAFYRVHSILNKLINVFLLNDVIDQSGRQCILMHSLVRDFAKQIFKSRMTDIDQGRLKEAYEKWEYVVQSHSRGLSEKVSTSAKDVIEDGSDLETHARGTASSSTQVLTSTIDVIQEEEEVRKMGETVFGPALEVIKQWKSEDGEILTEPFLQVCKIILPVIDKFGVLMSEVKTDFGGNITRLESKYNSNREQFNHLYTMVRSEVEAKTARGDSSCANGLLWLTRSMDFLLALFVNLLAHPDWSLSRVCTDSYDKTLKKWHGSIANSSFNVITELAPDRKKFMEVIGASDDTMDDIEKFNTTFTNLLEENHKFLCWHG